MAKEITREEAWALLTEYNKEPFHLKHGKTVEGTDASVEKHARLGA